MLTSDFELSLYMVQAGVSQDVWSNGMWLEVMCFCVHQEISQCYAVPWYTEQSLSISFSCSLSNSIYVDNY